MQNACSQGALLAPVGAPDFSPLSWQEYEKERDRFRREITVREIELECREASRRKAEAQRRLDAIEERATAAHAA